MTRQQLISVIIPIYNGEKYIDSMYRMLRAQTYSALEIILINDGSTDNTQQMCTQLSKEDERIRIISQSNSGVSAARNAGVAQALGDYFTFIDVDDYIYPQYIEKLLYLIQRYDADWAQCSFIKVPEQYHPTAYEKYRIKDYQDQTRHYIFNQEEAMTDFAYRRHLGGFPYLKLIKSQLAKQLKFRTDLKYAEDYGYVYELLKISSKVAYLDSVEYLYVQQSASATHQMKNRTLDYYASWKFLNAIREDAEMSYPQAAGGFLEKCYMQTIRNTARIEDKVKYKTYWDESINFLKENGLKVVKDRQNRLLSRMLGGGGTLCPSLMCRMCGVMFHHGFCLKRTA